MAIFAQAKSQYIPQHNDFYRYHYHQVILGLMVLIVVMMITVGVVLYQMFHKPLPVFNAVRLVSEPNNQTNHQIMTLTAYNTPNLLPDTILRWASKAATAAYTFDWDDYNNQIAAVRSYFTDAGWQDYLQSVNGVISTIIKNQLFISSVVAGTPVIANQGPLAGKGYTWRIQIPFLVTYISGNTTEKRNFFVILTLIHVPTTENPQGIGIDQFVMV